jgi:hypothetical protein
MWEANKLKTLANSALRRAFPMASLLSRGSTLVFEKGRGANDG